MICTPIIPAPIRARAREGGKANPYQFDDTARFLAGLPPLSDPLLQGLAEERSWQRHAALLNDAWVGLE